ncbi:MAG TPA: helix-turn-helix transcriptional regulator [Gemmataceae bacterium]|nr:helix-turn-helix transcriptional regulator [Gemmataceae bacterium]
MLARAVNNVYTAVMSEKREDPAMVKVRAWFEASGLSLHDLGLRMGYPPETARQSAWQFMKSGDPRISMLRKFAAAAGFSVEELVGERAKGE